MRGVSPELGSKGKTWGRGELVDGISKEDKSYKKKNSKPKEDLFLEILMCVCVCKRERKRERWRHGKC